jgi:hypothetical protein
LAIGGGSAGLALLLLAVCLSVAGSPSQSLAAEATNGNPPKGILPCGRRVVLTSVYRNKGGQIRFEGVANPYYAGKTAWIFDRDGEPVASAKVGQDGIFWASAESKDRGYTWLTKFIAQVEGNNSRWRRIGQAVGLRERDPVTLPATRGSHGRSRRRTRIKIKVTGDRNALVVIGRQTGCSRFEVQELASTYTNENGVAELNLPRPSAGDPYAIYRVSTEDEWKISPPIVVKSTGSDG